MAGNDTLWFTMKSPPLDCLTLQERGKKHQLQNAFIIMFLALTTEDCVDCENHYYFNKNCQLIVNLM